MRVQLSEPDERLVQSKTDRVGCVAALLRTGEGAATEVRTVVAPRAWPR
jgi:hypothetical protein